MYVKMNKQDNWNLGVSPDNGVWNRYLQFVWAPGFVPLWCVFAVLNQCPGFSRWNVAGLRGAVLYYCVQ
jgi:hypothetical protein